MSSSPLFCDVCGAANRAQALFCKACGQSLRTPVYESVSTTLTGRLSQQYMLKQRYVILGRAGQGGFGAVYKASDTHFGNRLVAIKEMSQSNLGQQELKEATISFKQEALLLAGLVHPNLPRIYEQFMDTGRSYLVMDYIDGETLEAHTKRLGTEKLPVEKVLDITIQLCDVLDYLHTRQPPIIFRDLKPANVMLTSTGHVFLIDFGIARHFKPGQAKDTTALGSLGYAAPEQYGKSQTTVRADIYSLGATLHQLLTGDNPSESPFRFFSLQFDSHPVLAKLDTLIMSMVSVEIAKRPASIALVKQELQSILTQYTSTTPLPHTSVNGQEAPKPKKIASGSKQSVGAQVRPLSNTLYICYGHSSRVTAVAWSPDGQWLASASYDKTVQVWDAANGKNILIYKEHQGRVNALAWSPHSKYLASASDDGTVQIWEALTGNQIFTYDGHQGRVSTLAWSPDGLRLASGGEDKSAHLWHMGEQMQVSQYHGHTDEILTVAWSPDGQRIASAGKDRKIQIWDPIKDQRKRSIFSALFFRRQEQKTLYHHRGPINSLAWSPDGLYLASASSDHYVIVLDLRLGTQLFWHGANNSNMINSVTWSPHGRYLAIGGNDKTVQVWNTSSKLLTLTYHGHQGYVMTVAWSPDGTRIASSGVDRSVQVWQVI